MKTVIFKWNPAISSYSMLQYLADIRELNKFEECYFDWSVWDHDQIHEGDRCYWLKVGNYGQIGIVGCGTITSEPYEDDDWSGKGRQTFYVVYEAETLINPDALPILLADKLEIAIPDFDWRGGHSGLVLTDEQAAKLDEMWKTFMKCNDGEFEKAKCLGRGADDLVYMKQHNE